MIASASLTRNSRADRFSYPEPLQPLTAINIHSKWRNKFIGLWADKNAAIADGPRFSEIVEKVIEGILKEGAPFINDHSAEQDRSPQDLAAELRRVQKSSGQEILKCVVRQYTYETFLYRLVNHTLRNDDINKVDTLGAYCFLLQSYIFNNSQDIIMDDDRKCDTVYRGISFEREDEWKKEINKCEKNRGQSLTWLPFTSSSKLIEEARKMMNQGAGEYKIMYIINIASNRHSSNKKVDISMISTKPWEKEVLFMSGCQFTIDDINHGQPTTIYMSS